MKQTHSILKKLLVGDLFWFWFCTKVESDFSPFVIEPMQSDSTVSSVVAAAKNIEVAIGGIPMTGIGIVTPDGFVQLSSVLASDLALQSLAKWVVANVDQYPALAQLKNAQFINIGSQGVVRSIHAESKLWGSIPEPIFRGSSAETLKRLQSLKREEKYWFWLAEYGPLDRAILYLQPVEKDAEGKDFMRRIRLLRQYASKVGAEVRGIVQQSQGDTLVFTTDSNITASQKIVAALNSDVQSCLHNALFLQKEGQKCVSALSIVGNETQTQVESYLTDVVATLHTLQQTGDQCFFWMGRVDSSTHLLLSPDKSSVKKWVLQLGKAQQSVRGKVVVSKQSWLEFRTPMPYPNFIDQLIAWTCQNHTLESDLSRLRGARMTQIDGNNTIIDRQKNTVGWQELP